MRIYNHIVCATDFSSCGEFACHRAVDLASQFDSLLTFLNVVENFPEDRSNEFIAPEHIDPAIYRDTDAHKDLAELAGRFDYKDIKQQVLFSMDPAWHDIVHYAKQINADLIVLGSHGKHGIASPLGSTASGVVTHAPCDVLAVRAQTDK
ncbi:MAG: universal stress protein [Gammaproteobacteria bacterium]|jgi:universal stress protein A